MEGLSETDLLSLIWVQNTASPPSLIETKIRAQLTFKNENMRYFIFCAFLGGDLGGSISFVFIPGLFYLVR